MESMSFRRTKSFFRRCFFFLVLHLLHQNILAQSAIYAGGPIYNEDHISINELRNSGFTNLIVWTIHINDEGDLNFNAEFPICEDGKYVGDKQYPNFRQNMGLLKTAPSSINRLEVGLSAWASSTFDNIKAIVERDGMDENSILYKNFKALKEAIPAIDAVNFDDESTYDEPSATSFAIMLADIGYKVSLAPYTSSTFWSDLAKNTNSQRPGTVDLVYLQVYAGGAGNNPCDWQDYFDDIEIYPGVWESQPSVVTTKMKNWKSECNIKGGFLWIFDEVKDLSSFPDFGKAFNDVFDIEVDLNAVASSPYPQPGAVEVPMDVQISWEQGSDALSHNVYFGTSYNPEFVVSQTETTYSPGSLDQNTTYYWRIDEVKESDTITGPVWSFHTLYPFPEKVSDPLPFNGATDVATNQSLSWVSGLYNSNFEIRLGTSSNLVSPDFIEQTTKNAIRPDQLNPLTTYYWRVDSKNETGVTEGETWSFTTSEVSSEAGGYSLEFDGTNDYVYCGTDQSLNITGRNITLEAWINPTEFKNEIWRGVVIAKDFGGGGSDYGYSLRCGGEGQIDISLGGGVWYELKSPANKIPLGAWTHIAGTYDGATIKLFINGDEVATKSVSFNIRGSSNPLRIGESSAFPGRVFNGSIDELRIWNVARTAEEIKSSMNSGLDSTYFASGDKGLVGYWRFEENQGQESSDLSFYKNHARLGSSSADDVNDPIWNFSDVIVSNSDRMVHAGIFVGQNYPNPTNGFAYLPYRISSSKKVTISIHDVYGKELKIIADNKLPGGEYICGIRTEDLKNGIYFIAFKTKEYSTVRKMIVDH